ncbi:MAG TPA: hypothetical protein VGB03_02745 [Acidimicrobiales bacterium]|jgi:hypothetical protein
MPVSVTVGDEDATIRLSGVDVVWALRRTARFPRSAVVSAAVVARPKPRGLRAPGTATPWVTAGTWRGRAGDELWCVRRDERVLVVDLAEGAPFRRVVLELDDPDAVAAALLPVMTNL